MTRRRRTAVPLTRAALATALIAASFGAFAAEPVRHIGIYVEPYYAAARNPGDPPQVAVGASVNRPLSSTRREDIVAVSDRIKTEPKLITPMTMMVLAIRLYDVGLRDDAVFWFYAAKDRFITLSEVVQIGPSGLHQVEEAVRSFATLAGPIINGYAFCDLAKQQALRRQALDWVEKNPYQAIFMPQLTAKPGSRDANLKASINGLRDSVAKERGYFDDPKNREQFYATRKTNSADVKFCWS
jgi:hypothetical protein